MLYRLIYIINNLYSHDIIIKLRGIIFLCSRLYAFSEYLNGPLTSSYIDIKLFKLLHKFWKKLLCNRLMHKTSLKCIAHARTLCLSIVCDWYRHVNIGTLIYINMAVTASRFNNRHRGIFNHRFYKSFSSSWNKHIYVTVRSHHLIWTLSRCIFDKLDYIFRQTTFLYWLPHYVHKNFIWVYRFFSTSKYRCISAFYTKRCRIDRDIWSWLKDNTDNSHRNSCLCDTHTVRSGVTLDNLADRVI